MKKSNKKVGKRLYEMGGQIDATQIPVYKTASIAMLGNPPSGKKTGTKKSK